MADQKKLLVLIDGTESSMQTLQYVTQLAPVKNFKIVLYHVLNPLPECFWDMEKIPQTQVAISKLVGWEIRQLNTIENFTENCRRILVNAGFSKNMVKVKIHNRRLGIARDILQEAEEGRYTGVVFGRRGSRLPATVVTGSVANKLITNLTFCPMIIAGRQPASKKLLIALDGSPPSLRTIDFVIENVAGGGYLVGLIHVIRGTGDPLIEDPEFMMPPEVLELAHRAMGECFEDVRNRLAKAGFNEDHIDEKIITGASSRAGAILQEAEDGGYDTIVIGRKGFSQVKEFSMGRVCHKVIHAGGKFSVWVT